MENNPELAELFEKAQSGNITQEEQARMANLMQELFAEAGYEARPSGGYGGGSRHTTNPRHNHLHLWLDYHRSKISKTPKHTTDVEISEDTNITIINALEVSELTTGTNVNGVVRRGEGGNIFVVSLDVAPQNPGGGFGFGGFGGAGGDNTVSAIQGTIAEVNDDMMIHVETTQGTLRLTANDESVIVSTITGTLADLSEGMGVVAIGPLEDGAIQARTIIAGSQEFITQQNGGLRGAGRRAQGQ